MSVWTLSDRQRGTAMVELSFALAMLAILVVGAVDFGRVFYLSMEVTAAARAGAQYAGRSSTISSDTSAGTLALIKSAAIAGSIGGRYPLSASDVTLGEAATTNNTTSEVPKCAETNGSAFYNPDGATKTCASACPPTGHATATAKVCYVKVTVTKTFSRRSAFAIGVPPSVTITRSAWWRVE